MEYGHFSENGREYIITRLDLPRPWINYLSNERYCSITSHTGGGYSFYESSGYDRVTREYPVETLLQGRPGRQLYIRDMDTSDYWSLNGNLVSKEPQSWETRHGLGYTKVKSVSNDIEGAVTYYVPLHDSCEVWMVKMKNNSNKPRRLSAFPYVEFCLGNYAFDMMERGFANLFNEMTFDEGVIFATKRYWNIPVARRRAKDSLYSLNTNSSWDKYAFLSSSFKPDSFDCLKEQFLGLHNAWHNPLAIEVGKCSNSTGSGEDSVGALQYIFELSPGEEKEFVVVLGTVYQKEEAKVLISKYNTPEKAMGEFNRLQQYWDDYVEHVKVETPDKEFDLSVNIWNKYQTWITAYWSRMDSAYIGGGSILGFRDTAQDILGVLPFDLKRSKDRTILILKHQFQDGSCIHNWDPRTNLGTKTGHSDDPLWLIMSVMNYIKESGDWSFLNELVEFYDFGQETVYDHLLKAIDKALLMRSPDLGGLGISLMGAADWNDGLDQIGREGRGESIMTTEFLCWMLLEMAEVAEYQRDHKLSKRYLADYRKLKEKLNFLCWDGEWYIRATNDKGEVIGSSKNDEGKIYLNAQSWAVLGGVATGERACICMDSVKHHLDTKYGPLLFSPAYKEPDPDIGIITRFAPGTKENGTVFNHTVCWVVIAECILGRGDRAYEYFKKTSFIERGKDPDAYRAEPYVYAEFIYGPDSVDFGQGSFTWTTGTAAWMWRACLDWILGVRPHFEGLLIDPCVPSHWTEFKVRRYFRNALYEIEVKNPDGVCKGIKEIKMDGEKMKSNLLPAMQDSKRHVVEVLMGEAKPVGKEKNIIQSLKSML